MDEDDERHMLDTIKNNGQPSEIAFVLKMHYRNLARESMRGLTPSPMLRDYWSKISRVFESAQKRLLKLEEE